MIEILKSSYPTCITCKNWNQDLRLTKQLDEKSEKTWGLCIVISGKSRMICPYKAFETREDFGCIEHEEK